MFQGAFQNNAFQRFAFQEVFAAAKRIAGGLTQEMLRQLIRRRRVAATLLE